MGIDLFTPLVNENLFHPNFANTISARSTGVQEVLKEWANGFVDRDGKFVREFQTTYNSSFWELYLFAVMKYLQVDIDFKFSSPDFVAANKDFVIEAVTANHAHDDVPEWEKTFHGLKHTTEQHLFEISRHSVIRLSNAFASKIKKYNDSYSQLAHVKDRPFIIAVSNYTKQDFNFQGDVAMQWLLYDVLGLQTAQKRNGTEVELGVFNDARFADVSGILYSSLATFGKARALGNDTGNFLFNAVRIKENYYPIRIAANKKEYKESLCDGLRLFINPHAKKPLNIDDFMDEGIRKFVPNTNGDIDISCHQDGDLCMRFVINNISS
ncbi:hypothetical protein ACFS6H_04040 [Terrimonas rubra]|uniref:Uncharacterized protein n=1 Tax=Terrimonas rubra TaxID=1035890 RepID=A0ABW6A0R5_9BACT